VEHFLVGREPSVVSKVDWGSGVEGIDRESDPPQKLRARGMNFHDCHFYLFFNWLSLL
jgi:hypothetical protein